MPDDDLSTALRRLAHLARLRETSPGMSAVDVSAGRAVEAELAEAEAVFGAACALLGQEEQRVVEQARLGLRTGWLDSTTLVRLADDPAVLRRWLHTAEEIDGL